MRAPGFWFQDPGLASHLLAPASLVWRLGAGARAILTKPEQSSVPVICVGNLTVGGAGKTPTTAAIAARLSAEGHQVAIVSRGYGGRVKGPYLVNPARDKAVDVGDEPLLLAQTATVWVARDRAAGARAAAHEGAELILLDDGFQNPGIVKEASILVVDAEQGFGNGQVMPAGPLREPMMQGIARADLVLLIGSPDQQTRAAARWPSLGSAIRASLEPIQTGMDLDGQPVVAFAGIGRPEKFFETLRGLKAKLIATHSFPDHHVYGERVLARMQREAAQAGAMLVTTEKDAIKLPERYRREVLALPVRLELEDWSLIDSLIARLLGQKHRSGTASLA